MRIEEKVVDWVLNTSAGGFRVPRVKQTCVCVTDGLFKSYCSVHLSGAFFLGMVCIVCVSCCWAGLYMCMCVSCFVCIATFVFVGVCHAVCLMCVYVCAWGIVL